MIDSHIHLDDERFDSDRGQMLEASRRAGVTQWVVPSATAERWHKVDDLQNSFAGVSAAFGLHPMFMESHRMDHLRQLDEWLSTHTAVAVGECGLDFFLSDDDREQQLELFRGQLQLADQHNLPVIVHARKALDEVIRECRRAGLSRGGVIHSFSGSLQQAEQLFQLGFRLGIAATVSFDRARKLRDVVSKMPVKALLIESDAPDQPGAGHRGERNSPAFVPEHLQVMAQLRETASGKLAELLDENARELFALAQA